MAAFPVDDNFEPLVLLTRQGKVHGNVVAVFVDETDCLARVPNAFVKPNETEIPRFTHERAV